MEKLSLKNRIKLYFERHQNRWWNGGDIERLALNNGYKASNASRRLRELAEEGFLNREERITPPSHVSTVWYNLHNAKANSQITKKEVMESYKPISQEKLW